MNKLLFLLALVPALASAQIQVQGSAGFTLELPVVIPQLVVVTPGIEVVPDVDYEVFHTGGYYWTRHEGRWYRSGNPRSGWVFMPRGVPPGLGSTLSACRCAGAAPGLGSGNCCALRPPGLRAASRSGPPPAPAAFSSATGSSASAGLAAKTAAAVWTSPRR